MMIKCDKYVSIKALNLWPLDGRLISDTLSHVSQISWVHTLVVRGYCLILT